MLILVVIPASIFAQSYQLNLQGTRQMGKASTGMAQPTDATSLFTNPGSAAFLEGNDVTAGITTAHAWGHFTDKYTNEVAETDVPIKTPFNLSASFGNPESDWRFGVSVYTPFGLTNQWEKESLVRFETVKMGLTSIAFQPTVSYKITDKFGLGVGLVLGYGEVNIKKDLPIQFQDGSYGNTQIKGAAFGAGVNVGAYYEVSDKVSLSATYRSGLKMKANNGDTHFNVPSSVQDQFANKHFKAELPLPHIYGIGASYKPHEQWVLNGEVFLSDWSNYDVIDIEFKDSPVNGEDKEQLIRNYKQGYSFRVGAEFLPRGKDYELRTGIMHNRTPIPNDNLNPDVPDADRLAFSFGGSYNFSEKFRMDASILYEPVRNKGTNKYTHIDGTYSYDLLFPSIGLTYKY